MGCRVSREAREVCKHVFVVSTKKNREMDEEGKRSLASTFEENKKKSVRLLQCLVVTYGN